MIQQRAAIDRRRFLRIAAAGGGMALVVGGPAAPGPIGGAPEGLRIWRGVALGADASLAIHHSDPATAERMIASCLAEVARLERIFSLYREDSALCRLNRDGCIEAPPLELVELMAQAEEFSQLTAGAFDVTVQPLWVLYARHFSQPEPDPVGPSRAAMLKALSSVGHDAIAIGAQRIVFARPDMAVTLNGIAQGYITDRVVDLLRRSGFDRSLVDMGETRALGERPSGGPWIVGLEDPRSPGHVAERIEITNRAVATSGGYGTQFDSHGRFNHIFDPHTGETSWRHLAVSVVAPTATAADALSTAFTLMRVDAIRPIIAALGISAHVVQRDGSRVLIG